MKFIFGYEVIERSRVVFPKISNRIIVVVLLRDMCLHYAAITDDPFFSGSEGTGVLWKRYFCRVIAPIKMIAFSVLGRFHKQLNRSLQSDIITSKSFYFSMFRLLTWARNIHPVTPLDRLEEKKV